jgi:hypothetical protein
MADKQTFKAGDRVHVSYWVNHAQERFLDEPGTVVTDQDGHRTRVHLDREVAARWVPSLILAARYE